MPKILKNKDPEWVKEKAQEYIGSNEDARFIRRLDMILLICDSHPLPHAAEVPNEPGDGPALDSSS